MRSVIGVAVEESVVLGRIGRGIGLGAQGRATSPEVEREHDGDQQQAARGHRRGQPHPPPAGDVVLLLGLGRRDHAAAGAGLPRPELLRHGGCPTRTGRAGGSAGGRLWCEEGSLRWLLERWRGRRLLRTRRQPGHLVVLVVEDRHAGLGGQVRGFGRSVARRTRGLDRRLDWRLGRRWGGAGARGLEADGRDGRGSPRQGCTGAAARRWPRPPPWRRRPPRSRAAPPGSRGRCAVRGGARHRPPPARSAPGRTSCPGAAGRRP